MTGSHAGDDAVRPADFNDGGALLIRASYYFTVASFLNRFEIGKKHHVAHSKANNIVFFFYDAE